MRRNHNEMLLLLIVALWGLSFSLMKPLLGEMGFFNLMAYRFVIGGAVVTLMLVVTGGHDFSKGIWKAGFQSGVFLFLAFVGHTAGLKYTTVPKNAFLVGSTVAFVPLILWWVYRERPSRQTAFQTVLAIFGLGMITLAGGLATVNIGDLITLIGTLFMAFYTIGVALFMRRFHALTFTAIQLGTVGVLSLVFMLLFETPVYRFTESGWASIAFLSIGLTGIAYYLTNHIQRQVPATRVTLVYTLEPFFATLFGWFFLSETIGLHILIGGVMIAVSMVLPYVSREKQAVTTAGEGEM
jgi:drug/metabolite transporter (DMT)-like permease